MLRKMRDCLDEKERESVVTYLKSMHRLMGNGPGPGSLTPHPRDFDAAMSRLGENSLNSPSQQRGPTQQERMEHTHSTTHL